MGETRTFAGHPVGLTIVTVAEALQAAGVYGVQALLILYMANFLFTPDQLASVGGFDAWRGLLESLFGPMSLQALATQTMGLYLGLFFLTPLLGGWLGDRHWGPRLTCILGAVLATTGMVMVVIPATFLPGLLVCAFGAGALRCNLNAQTGHLYARDDGRRDAAFSILAAGLNTGAFLGPLLIGALGERVNWQWGFAAASGCMALAERASPATLSSSAPLGSGCWSWRARASWRPRPRAVGRRCCGPSCCHRRPVSLAWASARRRRWKPRRRRRQRSQQWQQLPG